MNYELMNCRMLCLGLGEGDGLGQCAFTVVAMLVVAFIGAVLVEACAVRRQRAQPAPMRIEKENTEDVRQVRKLAVVQPSMRTAQGLDRVGTRGRREPAERWARTLPTVPLQPLYRAPAPTLSNSGSFSSMSD